ncbi:uncharacterized protein [Littorina saxatilis]|uniref:Uncharacterized protein n=1 Tax=Littorina saxatilis TaxID=31220 RepID=A0AAN9GJ63_9CAEN
MTTRPGGQDSTPGLRLDLVDSDDEPLDEGAGGARRPSTASLSRFRSCPQLSSADTHGQDSPGSDDMGMGSELCVNNAHFTQGSPRSRERQRHRDDTERSQTPTPPSTPGSRRSHMTMKEALAKGAGGESGAYATSKALSRARLEHALLGRAASTDADPALRLMDENFLRSEGDTGSERGSRHLSEFFEEPPDISIDERMTATEDGASTPGGAQRRYQGDQDSMDKCARWLQGVKMTSRDRLKSRSHIQLPPIGPH